MMNVQHTPKVNVGDTSDLVDTLAPRKEMEQMLILSLANLKARSWIKLPWN